MKHLSVLLMMVVSLTIFAANDDTSKEVSMNQTNTSGHNRTEVQVPHVTYCLSTQELNVCVDPSDSDFTISVTNLTTSQHVTSLAVTGTSGYVSLNAASPNLYLITVTSSSGNSYEGILDMNE